MNLLFRAVHNLPWGTLESEEVLVEVTEPLGKVSFILNITVMVNIINMPHIRNYCFFRGPLSLTSSVALNSRLHLLSPVSRWELWYRKHIAGWQIAWYRGNGADQKFLETETNICLTTRYFVANARSVAFFHSFWKLLVSIDERFKEKDTSFCSQLGDRQFPFQQKRYFCCDAVNTWNIMLMSRICKCALNEWYEGILLLNGKLPTPTPLWCYFIFCCLND